MISDKKKKLLVEKMHLLSINEKDIEEKFLSASTKGGEKANKTASLVFLKHRPTRIIVKVGYERCREDNRFFARRLLIEKIESSFGIISETEKKRRKLKKQKNKRKKRALQKKSEIS